MNVEQISSWIGVTLAVLGALAAVIKWLADLKDKFATKVQLQEQEKDFQIRLDAVEKRLHDEVYQLDNHVQTMTAMWVAKGPE